VSRSRYLQRRIIGIPGSIIFAANGSTAVMLGFSRQLVAEPHLGAKGFRYCGSILGTLQTALFPRQQELLRTAGVVAGVLTREFELTGINGIDFIARDGVPYPIEVNPRYSASMELVERGQGISIFEVHAQACHGVPSAVPAPGVMVQGKAIVFARQDVRIGHSPQWGADRWIADIPHAGERIPRSRPICTVFAEAGNPNACRRLLARRAGAVYRALESRQGCAA
jgi:predicted ATP-grasp superfamily ATP-dependent carboligase